MKKLFNALKGINKFGLALVLVAMTVVTTQSAFTSEQKVLEEWGQYNGPNTGPLVSGQWYRTADVPSGYQEVCDLPLNDPCKQVFDGDPNSGGIHMGDSNYDGVFDIIENP